MHYRFCTSKPQKDGVTWGTQVHGDGDARGGQGRIWLVRDHVVPVVGESLVDQVNGNPGPLHVDTESFAQLLWTRLYEGGTDESPNELQKTKVCHEL